MKKKILATVICISMLAIAIVGGTMAYFTDTHAQTNTFTAGNVGISLDEAKVKLDSNPESETFGDLIPDGTSRTTETQEYHLFPGMTVAKGTMPGSSFFNSLSICAADSKRSLGS